MGETWDIQRLSVVGGNIVVGTVTTLRELEYHSEWMGESSVVVTVKSPSPIDFHFDDFISYRGEIFYLPSDANVLKQSRVDTYGEGFVYDNVKFMSLSSKLKGVLFKDLVLYDNGLTYSSMGKFSFYAGSVEDLADRIAANLTRSTGSLLLQEYGNFVILTPDATRVLQRYGSVPASWYNYYSESHSDGETDVNIDVDNTSVWDALSLVYSKFGLSYYISGTTVVIGGDPIVPSHIFKYGKGNGFRKIGRTTTDDDNLATKLYGYGSDKNLPQNYYANLGKQAFVYGYRDTITTGGGRPAYGIATGYLYSKFKSAIIREDANCLIRYGNYTAYANANARTFLPGDSDQFLWLYLHPEGDADIAFYNAIGTDAAVKIYIDEGMNINMLPSEFVEIPTGYNYPALLSVNKLMLPGFPEKGLLTWLEDVYEERITVDGLSSEDAGLLLDKYRFSDDQYDPWVMSRNSDYAGVVEGVVNFDNGDDEIYPSIENTSAGVVVHGSSVEDNGYLPDTATDSDRRFTIGVAATAGLNWREVWDERLEDNISVDMKSGYCVGRSFKVDKRPSLSEGNTYWQLSLIREQDEQGRWLPYQESGSYCQVRGSGDGDGSYSGDTFVVTGIQLPASYIEAASVRLLIALCGRLDERDHIRYVYNPTVDNIYMARQHDAVTSGTDDSVSLHDTLRGGMRLKIQDIDLGIARDDYDSPSLYIDQLTIKEKGENGIPSYEVVLREEKEKGMLAKLTERISDITQKSTVQVVERQNRTLQYVEYDSWEAGKTYYSETVNPDTSVLETSDVWHLGNKWRCLRTGTAQEPFLDRSDWQHIEGNKELSMRFYDSDTVAPVPYGDTVAVRPSNVNVPLVPHVFFGYTDITQRLVTTAYNWTRTSGKAGDSAWSSAHAATKDVTITNSDLPGGWYENGVRFACTATVGDSTVTQTAVMG